MKDSKPSGPRFICRLVRRWNVIVEAPSTTVGELLLESGHVKNCADCRQYYRAHSELETALRRDAQRRHEPPPTGLDQRIIGAIALSARPSRRLIGRMSAIAFAGGIAGVALAIFILDAYHSRTATPGGEIAGIVPSSTNSSELVVPGLLWSSLPSSADTLLAQNPLQDEVDAVYSDARSAVRFLAMNFLPSASESTPEQETRDGRVRATDKVVDFSTVGIATKFGSGVIQGRTCGNRPRVWPCNVVLAVMWLRGA